jgi:hypothetical protein
MKQLRNYVLYGGVLLILAASLLVSCYPGDELTVSETDVVLTVFNENTDFATVETYAMPDTIIHLVGEDDEDDITRIHDQTILDQIRFNLDALGFTEVADPAAADVHVLTSVSVRDYTGYAYYGGWWGYWYGYYPPGWGWYPYYPSGGVAYSYSIGTIFIIMTDPPHVTPEGNPVAPIWIAGLNGLADTGTNGQRIENGINQAFAQSLYLGEGK